MIVNGQTLDLAFRGFKTVFTDAQLAAPSHYGDIAMTVPSTARDETYGWLGQFPSLREWIGPHQIKNLEAHGFTIKNRKFESTIEISRDDIADDRLGIFKPALSEMGQAAKRNPDELIFDLLATGFTANCYDGQSFFDTDHPVKNAEGNETKVANTDGGTDDAWFLLDTSRGVRPMIRQEREGYEFQRLTRPEDEHVFIHDKYFYGLRARVNAGFGLWQLAWGSKQAPDSTHNAAARAAMMGFTADGGRKLGIVANVLVVPPSLEEAALHLVNTETKDVGGSNPWKGTAKVIVTPYL